MGSSQKILLRSSDEEIFTVDEQVVLHSEVIKEKIQDGYSEDSEYPLPNVEAKTLKKVIDYCTMHTHHRGSENDLKTWDAEFVNVDIDTLLHLLKAADYLEIRILLDLLFKTIADMIKGESVEEIRKAFKIKDHGFTPDEEEGFRKEHPHLFEKKT